MKKRVQIILIAAFAAISANLFGQTTTANSTKSSYRPLQLSLVPYIGTNGIESASTSNYTSINLIGGISNNVGAAEIAGVLNIVKNDVRGFQASGVANLTKGFVGGFQTSGILNTSNTLLGLQLAGVANLNKKEANGNQIAGVVCLSKSIKGTQISGVYNYADSSDGCQLSGIANFSRKATGLQAASVVNIADTISGVQVAGIVNRARLARGVQVGIVNIADSCTGVSVGIVNIIKSGYHQLEFSGDELFYTNLAYRSGLKKLHSIVSAGIRPDYNDKTAWSIGFGVGSSKSLSPNLLLDMEMSYAQIVINDRFKDDNKLFKIYVGVDRYLFRGVSVALGLSANAMIYSTSNDFNRKQMENLIPYTITSDKLNEHKHISGWIGGKIAIRFN